MSNLGFTFNADEVPEDERSFDLIPNGTRCWFEIIEADVVDTKTGGKMIKCTAEIKAGTYKNRKVWININIVNANAQAQLIGQQELAKLCKAIGKPELNDTADLLFTPFEGTVGIRKDKTGEYSDQNVIKTYHIPGAAPAKPAAAAKPAAQTAPAAAAKKTKPWETSRAA